MTEKRLTDFGLHLPRELGTDPTALVEALQSLPEEPAADDRESFGERVLAATPPKRAADKRKAVAQRTSREAVDFEAAILEGLRKAEELPQSPGRYMCKRNGQWGEVEVLQAADLRDGPDLGVIHCGEWYPVSLFGCDEWGPRVDPRTEEP